MKIFTGKLSDYPWNIFKYFDEAAKLTGSPLWHGDAPVDSYLSFNDRQEAVKRLETARDKAREAWYLTYGENNGHEKAIEIWRQVFGIEFPAYGS